MSWKIESLDRLFNPRSIAIIGASDKPDRLGALSLIALDNYKGKIYPVNPRIEKIGDSVCYPNVSEIGEEIDLVIVALGAPQVLPTIVDCAKENVGSAIVFSAGFKELGEEGEKLQKKVMEEANRGKIAVIGPNCLGAGNVNLDLNATFFPHPAPLAQGKVSLVSQSGGVAGIMIYAAFDGGVGVAKYASIGNRVNVDFHDMIRYLRQDSETEVICLFVEGTENARLMYDEIAQTSSSKPVIVYKVGKTPVARSAALSHTGSLAGKPELYSASVKQAKGLEVNSVSEMIDTAKVLSILHTLPAGNSVAIVTHTLGPALIAAQVLEEQGARLPPPSEASRTLVQEMLAMPVEVPISNPIDLLAQGWAQPTIFSGALEKVMKEDQYDSIMTVFSPNYQQDIGGGMPVEDLVRISQETNKPVIAILNAPACIPPPGKTYLEKHGVPVFSTPERAAQALANVIKIG
ncbi:MAG: acetate--CoA ligase family protein [Candidatus Thorarchaeota archaeon]|jgi:acetyltransferase